MEQFDARAALVLFCNCCAREVLGKEDNDSRETANINR